MKVCFEPIVNKENAYINNIVNALKHTGVEFCNENIYGKWSKALNYLKLLLSKEQIIFHFNWLENITEKDNLKSKIVEKIYLFFPKVAHFLGKKVVWTMHNTISHHCCNVLRTKKFLYNWIKQMDLIVVHCNESKKYLIDVYKYDENKICLVPHGKYEQNMININKLSKLKENYNIKNEIIYMYLGKIDDYKNIPLLITAFEKLNLKNAKLLICGSFSNRISEEIKFEIENHKYKENVILDNRFIPEEEISTLLKIADVLVLPYDKTSMQNSGTAILAISNGVPFIIPEFGYIKDIKDLPFVYSYDYKEENEHFDKLSKKIKFFYDNFDKSTLNEISKEELKFSEKNLDWIEIGKNIYNYYKNL